MGCACKRHERTGLVKLGILPMVFVPRCGLADMITVLAALDRLGASVRRPWPSTENSASETCPSSSASCLTPRRLARRRRAFADTQPASRSPSVGRPPSRRRYPLSPEATWSSSAQERRKRHRRCSPRCRSWIVVRQSLSSHSNRAKPRAPTSYAST